MKSENVVLGKVAGIYMPALDRGANSLPLQAWNGSAVRHDGAFPCARRASALNDLKGNLCFRRFFQELRPVRVNEQHFIFRGVKTNVTAGNVVGHNHIAPLAFQFAARVIFHVMGFRRKAYQNAAEAEFRTHGAQNVRSTFQLQNHAFPRFLDFAVRNGDGAIIRYGGAEDGGVGVGSPGF